MRIYLLILFFLIFSLLFAGCTNKAGKYDKFAQCLTEKGVTMYGTEWCSHCKAQKNMFGSSFQYVDYVDCDLRKDECTEAGVKAYPSWVINGTHYRGEQPLYKLASLAGCELE